MTIRKFDGSAGREFSAAFRPAAREQAMVILRRSGRTSNCTFCDASHLAARFLRLFLSHQALSKKKSHEKIKDA